MPLYEFVCEDCDARFEAMKRIAERNEDEPCPKCGKKAPRVLSGFAVGRSSPGGGRAAAAPAGPPCGGGGG